MFYETPKQRRIFLAATFCMAVGPTLMMLGWAALDSLTHGGGGAIPQSALGVIILVASISSPSALLFLVGLTQKTL